MALPEFWATSVAKVMVGEQPCFLSVWAKPHLGFAKPMESPEKQAQMAAWKVRHAELLDREAAKARAEGWRVSKEQFFRVKGQVAQIAGKVDLILQAPERRPTIVDAKGGEPRDSDVIQVLIYMVMLPIAWGAPSMVFNGEVRYATQTVPVTPQQAAAFKPKLGEMMRRLGNPERPVAAPSRDACRFCTVPAEVCAERYVDVPDAETTEF